MKPINIPEFYTQTQIFFIERTIELLSEESIDTYRLRLHNPKSIIQEASYVIGATLRNNYKHDEYAKVVLNELQYFLKTEYSFISFRSISKAYFLQSISSKKINQELYHIINIILSENQDYGCRLLERIGYLLEQPFNENDYSTLEELDILTGFLWVEIKNRGYSKVYLHRFVQNILFKRKEFDQYLNIIKSLLTKHTEDFKIVFGIKKTPNISSIDILNANFNLINKEELNYITETKATSMLKKDLHLISTNIDALDYYTAALNAKNKLLDEIDLMHMGYNKNPIKIFDICIVIGSVNPDKASGLQFNYTLEGQYYNSQAIYEEFISRINKIPKEYLEPESYSKLISGLRYLRIGFEVEELESKLLNYWIGIEYFFSSNTAEDKVQRVRNYLKKIHSRIYFKYLASDFHDSIRNFKIDSDVLEYNNDFNYLSKTSTFEQIKSYNEKHPLLSFRAYKLKELFFEPDNIIERIKAHQNNIEWNIYRIYRIRNEIVHSASTRNNILEITSHLRYYLLLVVIGNFVSSFSSNVV